ncbi:Bgt-1246 [Blumeria graminis f. sp. tritici]|uniref:Probable guanine deaminase n=2 Tax=Blumeria graminis f. sp. tritici TaxID=62690 RepID=A0A061HHS1_BLUGR|nr:Guanine deaminase [Blumeria graminis f. sp. tritici 96224]VDB91259.1 Bgt-1246 [Blumeria graminis f. sp. tritici]
MDDTKSNQPLKGIFIGDFIHCRSLDDLEFLVDTAVCVDEKGWIVMVEREVSDQIKAKKILLPRLSWKEDEVIFKVACKGQFFFPGFIAPTDTHIHAPQYPNVGLFGKTSLLSWLENYTFPSEASLKDLDTARKVYTRCIQRSLSNGTTTAAYFATIDVSATNLLADICFANSQRAFIGRCCMDSAVNPITYRDASYETCLADTRATIDHIASIDPTNSLIMPIITPRFAPSCSTEAMNSLSFLQKETNLPVQTHISENRDEIALVKRLFPQHTTYAEIYDEHGLLCEKTILAHAVHLTEAEADLIKIRNCKISHCPISNSALGSGEARVRWLLKKGLEVGLGTDVSGGYSISILEAAKHALLVSRHVAMSGDEEAKLSVAEVLYLATRGGAKVVGLEKVGTFEVGMSWDSQLVGLATVGEDGAAPTWEDGKVDIFGWEGIEARLEKWLFNGDDRNTLAVWVQGRLVHSREG